MNSTLDEAPTLVQLTGLYALTVTILQPVVIEGHLGSDQIAALWFITFVTVMGGRMLTRWVAGRLCPQSGVW